MSWVHVRLAEGVIHVVPQRDWVEHETDEECVCGPHAELIPCDGRPDGWVYVHAALDGRP